MQDEADRDRTDEHALVGWLFLRMLGVVHLIAIESLREQASGLFGMHGVLPYGVADSTIQLVCVAGELAAVALIAGLAPPATLLALFAINAWLHRAGQDFLGFQWDGLLLESTFAALLITPVSLRPSRAEPSIAGLVVMRLLVFRLMWFSGFVKLASGDPTWADGTALEYHYWTQPLPNPISWYFTALPAWFHYLSCRATEAIELLLPFLVWPRQARYVAFGGYAVLLFLLAFTGNYGFFQLLSITVCLWVLDDAAVARVLGPRAVAAIEARYPATAWRPHEAWMAFQASPWILGALALSYGQLFGYAALGDPVRDVLGPAVELGVISPYGLFATMTTARPELVVEGSDDGVTWKPYQLPWKIQDIDRRPPFALFYMPRLDWQLWFAALRGRCRDPVLDGLRLGLLDGSPEVLGLFAENPFPDHPPAQVRITRWSYTFTMAGDSSGSSAEIGRWWTREPIGITCKPAGLDR
jgi:hypothetical protein